MGQPAYSTKASLLGKVPITTSTTDGVLTLADGRLTFATSNRTHFDHPIGEFHSVAPAANVGFHVWRRDRCYKFVPGHEIVNGLYSGNDALDAVAGVGQAIQAAGANRRMRGQRDQWVELLRPLVGSPPPGVTVRRPWSMWALVLVAAGLALFLIAIITAIVVLAS
jgi:hypothetical protein